MTSDPLEDEAGFLGRAIATARSTRGWKRMDLKRRMDQTPDGGVSYPYLADIENGKKHPAPAMLGKIARALDMTPFEIQQMAEAIRASESGSATGPSQVGSGQLPMTSPSAAMRVAMSDAPETWPVPGPPTALSDDGTIDQVVAEVYRVVEPRMRDWLLREIQFAVREEMLRKREGR